MKQVPFIIYVNIRCRISTYVPENAIIPAVKRPPNWNSHKENKLDYFDTDTNFRFISRRFLRFFDPKSKQYCAYSNQILPKIKKKRNWWGKGKLTTLGFLVIGAVTKAAVWTRWYREAVCQTFPTFKWYIKSRIVETKIETWRWPKSTMKLDKTKRQ